MVKPRHDIKAFLKNTQNMAIFDPREHCLARRDVLLSNMQHIFKHKP
ncbi:hypothetical protein [Rickettsia endosymbiont of Orchestes rusci]